MLCSFSVRSCLFSVCSGCSGLHPSTAVGCTPSRSGLRSPAQPVAGAAGCVSTRSGLRSVGHGLHHASSHPSWPCTRVRRIHPSRVSLASRAWTVRSGSPVSSATVPTVGHTTAGPSADQRRKDQSVSRVRAEPASSPCTRRTQRGSRTSSHSVASLMLGPPLEVAGSLARAGRRRAAGRQRAQVQASERGARRSGQRWSTCSSGSCTSTRRLGSPGSGRREAGSRLRLSLGADSKRRVQCIDSMAAVVREL
jgi:hypothetical protein